MRSASAYDLENAFSLAEKAVFKNNCPEKICLDFFNQIFNKFLQIPSWYLLAFGCCFLHFTRKSSWAAHISQFGAQMNFFWLTRVLELNWKIHKKGWAARIFQFGTQMNFSWFTRVQNSIEKSIKRPEPVKFSNLALK